MILTEDLIKVQGILISVAEKTGNFTKISHRGGNEQKILDVIVELQKYLSQKNYQKDGKANQDHKDELENIVYFLAMNTNFRNTLDLPELTHLIIVSPQLSKCLLANIVYGLNLFEYYCKAIEKLPIEISAELVEEMTACFKKSDPKIHLDYAYQLLQSVTNKLTDADCSNKMQDHVDHLVEISNILLRNLTGLYSNHTKNWKTEKIYQHMGFCLLKLFDLLLLCDTTKLSLEKFIENLIRTCGIVMKSVTLNVFCSWAEVEDDEEPLQNKVSSRAYEIIEKFKQYKPAEELRTMLSSIAKRPKSLHELIQEADVSTIIKNINKADFNQKEWFTALVNKQILKNKQALQCISTWADLCSLNDVDRLLSLCVHSSDFEVNKLIIKCAAALNLEDLTVVATRYFYKYKFSFILNQEINGQMMILFNKLNDDNNSSELFIKEIFLLLLQNPMAVLWYIYLECLKNSFYTRQLRNLFLKIKEIANIDISGLTCLTGVTESFPPSFQNMKNYIEFFNYMIEIDYFNMHPSNTDEAVISIFKNLWEILNSRECYTELNLTLQVANAIKVKLLVKENNMEALQILFKILHCRCKFLNFNAAKQNCTKEAVTFINTHVETVGSSTQILEDLEVGSDRFVLFYKHYLLSKTPHSLLTFMYPDLKFELYNEVVGRLMQILPQSVTVEWLNILCELKHRWGFEKSCSVFTDVLILSSQLVLTQRNPCVVYALKHCIQQYGNIFQEILQARNEEIEIIAAKEICRLLKHLPDPLKTEDGLTLVNIVPERALRTLSTDKNFVFLVITIHPQICNILAKKMIVEI